MYWLVFAITALVCKTALGYYQKSVINDNISALKVGFTWTFIGSLFFVPAAIYQIQTISYSISLTDIATLGFIGLFEVGKSVIGLKALESADLSIVTPLRKSYVVGLAIIEPLIFVASYNIYVIASTVIVVGGLFITIGSKERTTKETLIKLTDRGPILALVSGLLSIVLALGAKFGATEFSPIIFGGFIYSSLALGYTIWIRIEEKTIPFYLFKQKRFMGLGIIAILQSFFTWTTYSMVSATVASTFFQLTVLTSTVVGVIVLDEPQSKRRILGGFIVLIGVMLISHFGV